MATLTTDVVVIGAGAAGLATARELGRRGKDVVVLEASDRLGGRVHTHELPSWPVPVELGAEFVHGPADEVTRLAHEARLTITPVTTTQWERAGDRLIRAPVARRRALAVLQEAPNPDVSIAEHLARLAAAGRLTGITAQLARDYVTGFHAARLARVSSQAIANVEAGGSRELHRLSEGYGAMLAHLGRSLVRCRILCDQVVEHVAWGRGHVVVSSASVRVRGRSVVLTPGIGVLQAPPESRGGIRFTPQLPTWKQHAIAAFEMGRVCRVVLRFDRRLGPPEYDGGLIHAPQAAMPAAWPLDSARTAFVAWAGGERADLLEGEAVGDVAAASLEHMLGAARAHLLDVATHDWSGDPFIRGAYAYVLFGKTAEAARLAEPVGGTLFFAGEATEHEDAGTVHGALASGRRAAYEVNRALGSEARL